MVKPLSDYDSSATSRCLSNRFAIDTPVDEISQAVSEDGYAVIQNILDDQTLSRLVAELKPHLDVTDWGNEEFWGHRTKRFGALIAKSEIAREMLVNDSVLGVADRVLLEYCASYWVNYTGVMYLGPGETAQYLHRDTNLWPFANPCPPLTLATMWAINEFTAKNGATLIVPGSHRWDDSRRPEPDEIFAAEMPAGSVLLYAGNVIHGGGANRSTGVRFGVALHYVLGWLRQEETQSMTVTREQALELPEQVQRLMGYSLGSASLGMVDHMDPFEALTGIREDKPLALSSPELDANEAKVKRLTVVGGAASGRTRIDIDVNDIEFGD